MFKKTISKSKVILSALLLATAIATGAQQTVTVAPYMVRMETDPKTIETGKPVSLEFFIMDSTSMAPKKGLNVLPHLSMPEMEGMQMEQPKAKEDKPGHYLVAVVFPHPGKYILDLKVPQATLSFEITPGLKAMGAMEGMEMKGSLGSWAANREGSGTSWQPDSSPMFMKMLPNLGRYELSLMGTIQSGYVDAGAPRGDRQGYANSMMMLMARRETGGGTIGLDLMTSLDPITNGNRGVPNLFQTGETLNGKPLVDRQHPHDLFSEAAVSYSHPLGGGVGVFVYGGPIGEPALGNVMFMHRTSGMEIPEAPISHHWFDSTHISFGVATLGVTLQDKWKFEGSVFNGHEPDENRYDIDPISLNSASARISYNPDRNWSFSTSYGFLDSPEQLQPGLDQHRITASANYSLPLAHGDNLSTSLLFGQLVVPGQKNSNAYVLESTLFHGREAFFGRFERVDKDEIPNVPPGDYTINKVLLGDVHNFASSGGFDFGVGGYIGFYSFPTSLNPYYGKNPVSFGLFLRVRPGRM